MARIIVTCSRCFSADDVSVERAPDSTGYLYTCSRRHEDDKPHVWQTDPAALEREWSGEEGVLDDLYDPLLAVFRPEDPYLEHGVIEARLRASAPEVFARHVDEAGHVAFGGIPNTVSNRIGMALGVLRAQGHLVSKRGSGTGGWRFNEDIGFWALAPGSAAADLTWAEYAAAEGRSPEFTDDDRRGLTSQRQGIVLPSDGSDPTAA
jgi:hypothetical protein